MASRLVNLVNVPGYLQIPDPRGEIWVVGRQLYSPEILCSSSAMASLASAENYQRPSWLQGQLEVVIDRATFLNDCHDVR